MQQKSRAKEERGRVKGQGEDKIAELILSQYPLPLTLTPSSFIKFFILQTLFINLGGWAMNNPAY